MLCSVIPFVCVSRLYIYKIRSKQINSPAEILPCGLRGGKAFLSVLSFHTSSLFENFIWREALAVMVCDDEASLSECIPLLQVYSGDLRWGPVLNILSSHRYTLSFCILAYILSHKYPTEYNPTCNTEPIWKCFQLHTVPISLSNIFKKMTKPNGRKHKLLNINKWSTTQSSSDLCGLFNPS